MICMIIGITIPLITLLLGSLGDLFEFAFDGVLQMLDASIGFDASIDFAGIDFCLLPLSVQCLSGGALMFGGVGMLMYNGSNKIMTNIVAGIVAYIVAALLQTLIHWMKRVENTTYSKEQLLLFDAKVVNSILKGSYGSVSVTSNDGITTVYPAKADNSEISIRQDTVVEIVRFERNIAIVREKDLDEMKYGSTMDDLK